MKCLMSFKNDENDHHSPLLNKLLIKSWIIFKSWSADDANVSSTAISILHTCNLWAYVRPLVQLLLVPQRKVPFWLADSKCADKTCISMRNLWGNMCRVEPIDYRASVLLLVNTEWPLEWVRVLKGFFFPNRFLLG